MTESVMIMINSGKIKATTGLKEPNRQRGGLVTFRDGDFYTSEGGEV